MHLRIDACAPKSLDSCLVLILGYFERELWQKLLAGPCFELHHAHPRGNSKGPRETSQRHHLREDRAQGEQGVSASTGFLTAGYCLAAERGFGYHTHTGLHISPITQRKALGHSSDCPVRSLFISLHRTEKKQGYGLSIA